MLVSTLLDCAAEPARAARRPGVLARLAAAVALALLVACKAEEGGACTFDEDTYGTACRDGRLLSCEDGVWVDVGTSMGPSTATDTAVMGGPACECEAPDQVTCTYLDF